MSPRTSRPAADPPSSGVERPSCPQARTRLYSWFHVKRRTCGQPLWTTSLSDGYPACAVLGGRRAPGSRAIPERRGRVKNEKVHPRGQRIAAPMCRRAHSPSDRSCNDAGAVRPMGVDGTIEPHVLLPYDSSRSRDGSPDKPVGGVMSAPAKSRTPMCLRVTVAKEPRQRPARTGRR